ncbi:YaaL family protein [Lacticaseibacillus paracasei]|uniref:YaaL family protein n=1 Tax=Lacticaseibacillus paracasei TaxID=1597 RepID=UPI002FD94BA9
MFGRKQVKVKEEKDEELMMLVYRVRDQMAAQRKLVATFREVDEQTKAQVALQTGLFAFLYREARTRQIKGELVARVAAEQIAEYRDL